MFRASMLCGINVPRINVLRITTFSAVPRVNFLRNKHSANQMFRGLNVPWIEFLAVNVPRVNVLRNNF